MMQIVLLLITLIATIARADNPIVDAVRNEVSKECSSCRIEVQFLSTQQMTEFTDPFEVRASNWRGQTEITIVSGDRGYKTEVYIRWIDKVVIADRNIKQGDAIGFDNVKKVEKDVTFFNKAYLRSPEAAIGLIAKRVFARGQVIEEDLLKKPNVVKYGQPIKVEFAEKTLTLTMHGQARGAGAVGDLIPVFIPNTKTSLQARIIDQNNVRIE